MRNASTESPIDDLTYDVLTVLHAKAKALEAYDKYIEDAVDDEEVREVFEELKRQDSEHVRVLKEVLARRLDEDLGYEDEDYEDESDEDYADEAEDEEEEVASTDTVATDEDGVHLSDDEGPPPRRGESSHRRGV